jgi:hypothetical protein
MRRIIVLVLAMLFLAGCAESVMPAPTKVAYPAKIAYAVTPTPSTTSSATATRTATATRPPTRAVTRRPSPTAIRAATATPNVTPRRELVPEKLTTLTTKLYPYLQQAINPTPVGAGLAPPFITSIVQAGTLLSMNWNPVPDAVQYQILMNTTPSTVGATELGWTTATHWIGPLNTGALSELIRINPGFESGDFTGWNPWLYPEHISISSTYKHSGTYSCRLNIPAGVFLETGILVESEQFSVIAANTYAASLYAKVLTGDADTLLVVEIRWRDSSNVQISASTVGSIANTADWTLLSLNATAPAGAAIASVYAQAFSSSEAVALDAYVDDFSLIGQPAIRDTTLLYAVRALDAQGNISAPSTWLVATQSPSALGTPSGDHTMLDPVRKGVVTSNFVAGTAGASITPDGIDGKLLSGAPPFGDASDGDLSTTGNVTLTKDKNYGTLTVNAGHTVNAAGFVIRAQAIVVAATGVIACDGSPGGNGALNTGGPATGGAGGGVPYSSAFPEIAIPGGGGAGGDAVNGNGTTTNGNNAGAAEILNLTKRPMTWRSGGGGGGGGARGNPGCTGGAAGVAGLAGAAGGSGGNGVDGDGQTGAMSGGGGGGGGGILRVYAKSIDNAGSIQAKGGAGGNGASGLGPNKGGNGGGGGGGVVILYYRTTTGSGVGTLSATGGAAGTGGNGGAAGSDGVTASYQI